MGAEGLGEGWVVEMSQLKIMPITSCFKRLSICISIPFHRFGVFIHSIRRKNAIVIYTSQNIKPLHRAVGSLTSPHYGDLNVSRSNRSTFLGEEDGENDNCRNTK